jgi:crotonobetainyl-CoA:carnitine CoA-transferase CaiB-like acyl-CoA transferase
MKPLQGLKVLDLSSNIAGPFATLNLARLGARIIKVERPAGDPSRQWAPMVNGMSLVFDALNRGKESVAIDMTSPEGRALVTRLIEWSDVLIHNFTARVASKLCFEEMHVKKINPDILYCSVGAFGSGPHGAQLPGYDGVAQAFAGIMEMTGAPGSPPTRCAPAVIDMGTGQWVVIAVLSAVLSKQRGEHVSSLETTLVDTALGMVPYQATEALLTGERPPKYGTGSPLGAPHEVFPTMDRPIFIGAPSENLWRSVVEVLEAPELLEDRRFRTSADRLQNLEALRDALNARLARRPASEWHERLVRAGVPTAEVLGLEETVVHPLALERGWFEQLGDGPPVVRMPVLVDGKAVSSHPTAPHLGEHTERILRELGFDPHAVGDLLERGTVISPHGSNGNGHSSIHPAPLAERTG